MWIYEHSRQTSALPNDLWAALIDAANRPTIDENTGTVSLETPITTGTVLKTKGERGGRWTRRTVKTLHPPSRYIDESRLFFAKRENTYSLYRNADGTEINIRVQLSGPLSPLWGFLLGKSLAAEAIAFASSVESRFQERRLQSMIRRPHFDSQRERPATQTLGPQ
jgi:hypothetical protein